ncbi:NnrU family protein [Marichromatium gracile]|uniref:Putative membrane protein n=1 Tax=Marichromatium gracile TaxID=1048 RepID=A0A4R4AK99_MARGR|nr:NnrU family protein [Marichromatium gracile]MBK1707478.1 NnrU family protein [Marichromatium gracile]MBO8086023.1 NnrU family protein [Marichromatium sp.]TCW39831.1 putative membrane protein [Marichromatium gracile]
MAILILGLVLFLGGHSVSIFAPEWRARAVARIGELPWKALYALFALFGFLVLVWGYGLARQAPIPLYDPPVWLRHINLLLMLPVFTLLLAAYLPGRIQHTLKHPMLVAVKLWALAHLLANGTLADVLLFGGFLAWAVADRISLKRRAAPRVYGMPASPVNDALAIVGGLVLYLAFMFWLHRALLGVAPIG